MSTRNEVIDFLNSAQRAKVRKLSFENRLAEVRAQAERLTKVLSPTPGVQGGVKGQEAVWAALADETTHYVEELRVCGEVIKEVDDFISGLRLPLVNREILRLRHCNGLKWKQIQTLIRKSGYWYSEKYLWELERKGIDEAVIEYEAQQAVRKGREEMIERFKDQRQGYTDRRRKDVITTTLRDDVKAEKEKEKEKND